MKVIFLEGEVVPASLVTVFYNRVPTCKLVNVYSTWESEDITYCELTPESVRHCRFAPAGNVMPAVTVRIVDKNLRPTMLGVPGEIVISSPALSLGYLNDPVRTADKFIPTPFPDDPQGSKIYRTGDAGRFRPDGRLEVMGRRGLEIKIRGFKVGLEFVEAAIRSVEGVISAVVQPVIDEATGQPSALSAFVVGENGRPGQARIQWISDQLREKVPEYAVPTFWVPMDTIPMLPGLKVDRKALPEVIPSEHRIRAARGEAVDDDLGGIVLDSNLENALMSSWQKVLGTDRISLSDNFFEIGGHSLAATQVVALLTDEYGLTISILDLYQNPTIQSMIRFLTPVNHETASAQASNATIPPSIRTDGARVDLAVVGMAIRVPGASTLDQFWYNLTNEVCSARTFSIEELAAKGVSPEVLGHDDYVRVGYACSDVDKFDYPFWGIAKQEALLMDPQQRLFLETAWHALENAGYAPKTGTPEDTGVFAACGMDGYLVHHLQGGGLHKPLDPGEWFLTEVGNEKDYISTRASFQMNLGGPSMTVNSACSSGLVAVAMAAQELRSGTCSMALAGASSLTFPHFGYLYSEGLVASPDGLVRPFDQGANGTVFGDGVGCVVLKRLDDALRDGDHVWAVLRGSAISNDGSIKAGYTAPGVAGQRRCVSAAMRMAEVTAHDVSYVECHATATNIGDAIEIRALADAFNTLKPNDTPTALGSIKGNIGHANCAAGITGFIKAALCLHHKTLVRTCHFDKPSEKLPLARTTFFVNTKLRPWLPGQDDVPEGPLICGVSSFGIGGTNAHVVLAEAPATASPVRQTHEVGESGKWHILTISAKSREGLRRQADSLVDYMESPASGSLEDIAHTLHIGREEFALRATVTAQSKSDAIAKLRQEIVPTEAKPKASVAFVFPGQGSQYMQMGAGLYHSHSEYRSHFDRCCEVLLTVLNIDIRTYLFARETDAASDTFSRPSILQPSIFITEYSLAMVLLSAGIRPVALAGHSIGEYVAAVIAGVVSLPDALGLIATRAKATEEQAPEGAMLSIAMSEAEASAFLVQEQLDDLAVAAVNSPVHLVLSGPQSSIERAKDTLVSRGMRATLLHVNRAFHSPMMKVCLSRRACFYHATGMSRELSTSVERARLHANQPGRDWLVCAGCRGASAGLRFNNAACACRDPISLECNRELGGGRDDRQDILVPPHGRHCPFQGLRR
jgi:3-oxoacyl-(acyl-carrier-protein) synthase/acyl carrier protein